MLKPCVPWSWPLAGGWMGWHWSLQAPEATEQSGFVRCFWRAQAILIYFGFVLFHFSLVLLSSFPCRNGAIGFPKTSTYLSLVQWQSLLCFQYFCLLGVAAMCSIPALGGLDWPNVKTYSDELPHGQRVKPPALKSLVILELGLILLQSRQLQEAAQEQHEAADGSAFSF